MEMSGRVVLLFPELQQKELILVKALTSDTVDLIHMTRQIPAIKLLTSAYEILDLWEQIIPSHDRGATNALDLIRTELFVKYGQDFRLPSAVITYYNDVGHLTSMVKH